MKSKLLILVILIVNSITISGQSKIIENFPLLNQSSGLENYPNDCGEWAVASILTYWNNREYFPYTKFNKFYGIDVDPDGSTDRIAIANLAIELQGPLGYIATPNNGALGTEPVTMRNGILEFCNSSIYGHNYDFEVNTYFDVNIFNNNALWELIKYEIDNDRPVLFLVMGFITLRRPEDTEWSTDYMWHYMPIYGYNENIDGRRSLIAGSLGSQDPSSIPWGDTYYLDIESTVNLYTDKLPDIWTILPRKHNNEIPVMTSLEIASFNNSIRGNAYLNSQVESASEVSYVEYEINYTDNNWEPIGRGIDEEIDFDLVYDSREIEYAEDVLFRARAKDFFGNYSDWLNSQVIYTINNIKPTITGGVISNQSPLSGESVTFDVLYTDSRNYSPTEVRVIIDGAAHTMVKDMADNTYSDGVHYTYATSFNTAKLYNYSFTANDNNGSVLAPYPESGTLSFVVSENPAGWDLRVTGLTSNLTYMLTGQGVTFTGTIHNNSNSPDKIYSNVSYKFELFSPSGSLIDDETGMVPTLNQGASVAVIKTLYTQNTYGNYTCILTIFPLKDAVLNNNSMSKTVIVGSDGPSHEFYISSADAYVDMMAQPSYTYKYPLTIPNNSYKLTYINNSKITIQQDSNTPRDILYQSTREYNSNTIVLINEFCSTSDAFVSFGSLSTNYVSFTSTNITCFSGDEISFVGYCAAEPFDNTDPDIYENTIVADWFYSTSLSNANKTATWKFRIPGGASLGTYNFKFGARFSANAKFLRSLVITVVSPPPAITSLSRTTISADDQLIITGTNFGTTTGMVKFGSLQVTPTLWTSNSITCTVPQGITNGLVTVTNTNGTSNGISYIVLSSTGIPVVISPIPDQTINPGEVRQIAELNSVFQDPNGGNLTFTASSGNPEIAINPTELISGKLSVSASANILTGSTVTVTAIDITSKAVSDEFIISVTKILEVSPVSSYVGDVSGSVNLTVRSNVDWSVSENSDWLSAAKTNSTTLTITYNDNPTIYERSASLTISATGVTSQIVNIVQNGKTPALIVTPATVPVGSSAGEVTVTISSNTDWTVSEESDWLSAAKTSPTILTIMYNQNTGSDPRSAIINLSGAGVISQTVTVNQSGSNSTLTELSTAALYDITMTTATAGGNISDEGGSSVTARGVCWSTSTAPTVDLSTKTTDGTGTGTFTSSVTGLNPGTKYYLRAYATNSVGTSYGNEINFTTYKPDAITDADGNYYNILTIGTQTWLAENLKTTKFNDGVSIPNVTSDETWNTLTTDAYSWYKNDQDSYMNVYGAMYNWYAVNTQKLCPSGWHVPSDAEWHTLALAIDPDAVLDNTESLLGGKLKETGTEHWRSPNTGATNEFGFNALPGGNREDNIPGGYDSSTNFEALGIGGCWWTSTEYNSDIAWYRNLGYNTPALSRHAGTNQSKRYGYSVRCIKDAEETKTNGITEVYSLSSTTANRRAQTITFSEAGTIQSISIYHNGGTGQVLLGVYADAGGVPGARLGVTPATTINTTTGWQTISLTNPVTVTSGQKVWLSWVFQNNPGIRYISGTPARAQSTASWTGGMPDPFGSSSFADYRYSVYCTYTTGTSASPNLKVNSFSAPSSGFTGDIIGDQIRLFIENQGSQTDESFSVGFYISNDSIITTNDFLLTGGREFVSGINQGTIIEVPLFDGASIPGNLSPGEYYIGVLIDEDNRIIESVENDNFYSLIFTLSSKNKTLGVTEVYNLSSTTANRRAQTVTFTEAGIIQSISIYHNGGAGQALLGVYADASGVPGARLGVTPATTLNTTSGWQTVSLTNPVTVISGQKVWLSWVFQNNPGIRYIAGTPARAESPQVWAGGMPDPFGASSLANYRYSIYCTYTTGSGELPSVATAEITSITSASAQSGGNVTSDGGSAVTARGVCWSTTPNPTADLITKTTDGTGTGTFTSSVTGLSAGTTYYLRAYATNNYGTAYGNELSFKTNDNEILDNFEDNFSNLDNWILYGDPNPQWISSIKGRDGIFDNNGDSNYNSGAISQSTFLFAGKTIESDVYLDFTDLSGCWTAPSIGIANPEYQSWGGYDSFTTFSLVAVGDACWASPSGMWKHAYFFGGYLTDSGWEYFGEIDGTNQILADQYANKWTNLKITIDINGIPSFYADGNLIYSGTVPVASNVRATPLPLWLGERSSGFAGKAYHDFIRVSSAKILGNTDVYSLSSTTANRRAQTVTFPEAGTIQSISIYHNGGTGQLLLGVYADAAGVPGPRLGLTPATTISSSAGWQTVTLTSPVTVTSGQKVWLSWVFENNPGIRYIAGTPSRAQSAALWAGGMPDPFGSSSLANFRYSVYCTYLPGSVVTKTNGITEVYSLSSTTANRRAQTITFTEAGTIQSISIYHNGGSGRVLLGVYADAAGVPGARLGVTPATTINSSAGWQTVSLTSTVTVTSGQKVWLSWVFENNPGIRYMAGTPARAQSVGLWSGGMPDPFGSASFADYRYSVYCTYITSGSDEVKSVNEPLKINSQYQNEEEVLIYPNPAFSEVTVSWKNNYDSRLSMTIYDLQGRPVKRIQIEPDVNEIFVDLSELRYGIYLFELKEAGNNKVINRSRIIKY